VPLARKGDRDAFAELVRRREVWGRTLLLRCCNDATLADDLAQAAFMQAWKEYRKAHLTNYDPGNLERLFLSARRQAGV